MEKKIERRVGLEGRDLEDGTLEKGRMQWKEIGTRQRRKDRNTRDKGSGTVKGTEGQQHSEQRTPE